MIKNYWYILKLSRNCYLKQSLLLVIEIFIVSLVFKSSFKKKKEWDKENFVSYLLIFVVVYKKYERVVLCMYDVSEIKIYVREWKRYKNYVFKSKYNYLPINNAFPLRKGSILPSSQMYHLVQRLTFTLWLLVN